MQSSLSVYVSIFLPVYRMFSTFAQSFVETFIDPFRTGALALVLSVLWTLSPLWAPIALGALFWYVWTNYVLIWFLHNQKMTLLELKIPTEVYKTPVAMEIVLASLHLTFGETTFIDLFWLGKRRTFFSFEMVSDGGEVHFYVWTRAFFKNQVEAAFYAQYPEVEIMEVEDYTLPYIYDRERMEVFAVEWMKSDPRDVLPIRTYVDYGLDKAGDDEITKNDPMTPILEFLGRVNRGGHAWIQIIFQAHRKDKIKKGTMFAKTDWQEEGNDVIDKILERGKYAPKAEGDKYPQFPRPSPSEIDDVKTIARHMTKLPFNVGMRGMYFSDKEVFDPVNIIGLLSCWKQYNMVGLNGISTAGRLHYKMAWPWEDFRDIRKHRFARKAIDHYKRRAYFYPPYRQRWFMMSTEELASLFHIPGTVAMTPTLPRLSSKRGEPPSNLPI